MMLFRFLFLTLVGNSVWGLRRGVADDESVLGLKWRNIGPALVSGRIADIARHPEDLSVWYVAVGSGGVWKTSNGVTWKPIFDEQSRYSIGVTVDPSNPRGLGWYGRGCGRPSCWFRGRYLSIR